MHRYFRAGYVYSVRVVLNGIHDLNMLVDTGSAFTLIAEDWAEEFGFKLEEPFRSITLVSVERFVGSVIFGRLGSLQVGSAQLRGVEAGIMRLPEQLRVDGIIGLNVLRNFRVTFEFDSGTLVLREFPSGSRPGLR